jgi:hypothetical protein
MKLQVNNSGAWKQVLVFGVEDLDLVKTAAIALAAAAVKAESVVAWRILDGVEQVVLMCDQKRGWYAPHWMLGREIVP